MAERDIAVAREIERARLQIVEREAASFGQQRPQEGFARGLLGADEAHELGLVSRVYPNPEALHEAANELAAEIASNSPLAVQGTKAVLNRGRARDVEANLDYVALWNAAFLHSNDFIEGVSSFIQKRPPEFTGE